MDEVKKILKEIIFPKHVEIEVLELKDFNEKGLPEEEKIIAHAAATRKKEFRSGRYCARKALEKLGITNTPILFESNRAPIWPDGFSGSISHTKELCIGIACKKEHSPSLGVDIENLGRVKEKLWKAILRNNEQDYLLSLPKAEREDIASLIFSIKECFYKYQYPLTQKWLGFLDAEVEISLDKNTFHIKLLSDQLDPLKLEQSFNGKFAFIKGLVVSGMA